VPVKGLDGWRFFFPSYNQEQEGQEISAAKFDRWVLNFWHLSTVSQGSFHLD
jgi:hypothetical protein